MIGPFGCGSGSSCGAVVALLLCEVFEEVERAAVYGKKTETEGGVEKAEKEVKRKRIEAAEAEER